MGKKKGVQRSSDDVVEDRTGKSTKTWNKILAKFNVKKKRHTLAAKHLLNKYKLSSWWSQVVVIRYEYERALKKMRLSIAVSVLLLSLLTTTPFSQSSGSELQIPEWIKNNAKWWAEGKINDSDFAQGIQYLVNQDIMRIPKTSPGSESSEKIPSWVKNNAGWWADGRIADSDFISGIQYLIKSSVIRLRVDSMMKLSSSAFENNGIIPKEYTCDGADISPPLTISGVPSKAKSLALVMDDPDAPGGTFTHWVGWNLPPEKTEFVKGEKIEFTQGRTSFGEIGYGGPCPPSGTHRYFFKLYALDSMLDLKAGSTKKDLEKAIEGHIIEQATLIGKYSRS